MKYCIKPCKSSNRESTKISFFRFPSDKKLSKQWTSFCRKNIINIKTSRICMKHFNAGDFENMYVGI